jgi:protein-tyrosine phosphatase
MNPELPFPYSYWAVPGRILAGRCPGSIDSDGVHDDISALLDAGVTLIVNLMEVEETEILKRYFESYETHLEELGGARGRAVRLVRFPIRDRSVPTVVRMRSILETIRQELAAGGVVYVHCLGGIGRTGTVVGCYLAEMGHSNPLADLQNLTASEGDYFWPTPQTQEQHAFVENWRPGVGL